MAAKLNLRGVHEFQKVPNSGMFRLSKINPAMRLGFETSEVWIQGGMVFTPGGETVKELPKWFEAEIKKCTPEALASVGWKGVPKELLPSKKPAKQEAVAA